MPLLASLLYQIAGLCAWSSSLHHTKQHETFLCHRSLGFHIYANGTQISILFYFRILSCILSCNSSVQPLFAVVLDEIQCWLSANTLFRIQAHRRLKFCYSPLHRWGVVPKRSRARSYEVGTSR